MSAARSAYAHDAVLVLDGEGDDRAPGGAITLALCGSWTHEPPCPLSPHHTSTSRTGDRLHVRVLFAAAATDEQRVRDLVAEALAGGESTGPDGVRTSWRLLEQDRSDVRQEERAHADRLAGS
ncbi:MULTISPECIES: hypothetical protein [unclassified Geodermatophilus]|uniref:hypothetical protein n=1 Tax=unclassified Geodermatophilus TaxID=2637632 RepID=UPI003EEABE5E